MTSTAARPLFTAHNIRLDDGTFTRSADEPPTAEAPRFLAATRLLDLVFAGAPRVGIRVADVGCLEGGYSAGFARLGYQVLGLEVREDNFAACRYVQGHTNLPNLTFVQDDAWNLARYGPFDAVFCCGLLYHLDRPRQFLALLAEVTSRMVILDTHVAPAGTSLQPMLPRAVRGPLARVLARYDRGGSLSRYILSRTTRHEGVEGRWYLEFSSDDEFRARATARWASWNNRRSFWMRKEHVLQALHDGGFDLVLEDFDLLAPRIDEAIRRGYYKVADRGMFVGIKSTRTSPS